MDPDILRVAVFLLSGIGAAFALATNVIAFKVLRPPKKLGFLWWHVTAVTAAFFCWGAVILYYVNMRVGQELSWRTFLSFAGACLFAASQVIIFAVEKRRLMAKTIVDKVDKHGA